MNMFLTNVAMLMADLAETGIGWLDTLLNSVTKIVNPILIMVAFAGVLYAIIVGVKFVKADNKDEREEAKQKLITVIIGIVVTLALIALFYFLAYNIGPGKTFDIEELFMDK